MAAIGWGVIAFGLQGLFRASNETNPPGLFRLLVGLNVINDAIVVPLTLLGGFLVRRFAPRWLLMPAQFGLFASVIVTLYAYPLVSGAGRSPRAGFSRLPLNYAHGLLAVLGVVWLVSAGLAAWSWKRRVKID